MKHFADMVTLSNRLKTADKTRALTDADFATKLLLSLPEELEEVMFARLYGSSKELNPKTVRNDVMAPLKRCAVTKESDSTSIHQNAAMRTTGSSRNPKFDGECWN